MIHNYLLPAGLACRQRPFPCQAQRLETGFACAILASLIGLYKTSCPGHFTTLFLVIGNQAAAELYQQIDRQRSLTRTRRAHCGVCLSPGPSLLLPLSATCCPRTFYHRPLASKFRSCATNADLCSQSAPQLYVRFMLAIVPFYCSPQLSRYS